MVESNTSLQNETSSVQTLVPSMANQVHVSARAGLTFFKE